MKPINGLKNLYIYIMTMKSNSSLLLAAALIKFVKNVCRAYVTIDGIVTVVNDNYTVDVEVQGVTYSNCPIAVLIGTQASVYPVPVVGTKCLVKWRDGNRALPQIESFDQIEKLYVNCTELVEFNGGENGGIPLTPNLVTQINKVIDNQNQILSTLKSINIAATPFSFAPLFSSINALTDITATLIQNTKITQ